MKMDKNLILSLKKEIQIFMTKFPNAKTSEGNRFILSAENSTNIDDISQRALNKLISDNTVQFRDTGDCVKHIGGNRRLKTRTSNEVTLKLKKKLV